MLQQEIIKCSRFLFNSCRVHCHGHILFETNKSIETGLRSFIILGNSTHSAESPIYSCIAITKLLGTELHFSSSTNPFCRPIHLYPTKSVNHIFLIFANIKLAIKSQWPPESSIPLSGPSLHFVFF